MLRAPQQGTLSKMRINVENYSKKVKPTVIGVVTDFSCCSKAPMMASTESLKRPVASSLEDEIRSVAMA